MKLNDLTDIFIPITINKYFSSCNTPQWISNFWINAIGMPEYLLYFTLNLFPYDSNGLCIYNLSGSNKVTAHL